MSDSTNTRASSRAGTILRHAFVLALPFVALGAVMIAALMDNGGTA